MTDIFERVKGIVSDRLTVNQEQVTESAAIIEDLGADSLDVVELSMALEQEFGLEISDDDVQKLKTVGDIVQYVKSHMVSTPVK